MSSGTCRICTSSSTKYKCSACKAPICSLPCYKQHQEVCDQLAAPHANPVTTAAPQSDEGIQPAQPNPSLNPADLDVLFNRYPSLKPLLQQIYQSTREPNYTSSESSHRRPWKPERGFEQGLETMRATLDAGGEASQALDAFIKLVSESNKSDV